MGDKQTLYLTKVQEKAGVSVVEGMNLVYGSKEMIPLNNGLFRPKYGFYASKPENFEGFPSGNTIEVDGSFCGTAFVFDDARITPTVTLEGKHGGMCLIMSDNSYASDALFWLSIFSANALLGNATVKGGVHCQLRVEENGYVEGSDTSNVYVTGSARLINAGGTAAAVFGGDAEVNLSEVNPGKKNAASVLLQFGWLHWDLGQTQPFKKTSPHPDCRDIDTPQNTWAALDVPDEGYLYNAATSLEEAPLPEEATMCLSSTLHKKHKKHCKCMFYYALYLLADPVALHYFARLEGNTAAVESSPLADIPYKQLEAHMQQRTVELEAVTSRRENTMQNVFNSNLVIPVAQVKKMQAFKEMARRLSENNGVIENSVNEALWYLNYLQVAHNITPDEFFKTGEPDEEILEMTARSRGII